MAMPTVRTHASLEGAQHGDKNLLGLARFARDAGAKGVQPSNYHLMNDDGAVKTAAEVQLALNAAEIRLSGISMHCLFWVLQTAWTGSPTIRPFIPEKLRRASVGEIEAYCEDTIIRLFDLAADLGAKVIPMFWGVAYGWEVATLYPWGFWSFTDAKDGYDLIKEGDQRFLKTSSKVRKEANQRRLLLAHEIHPGTAAACADDFLHLVEITGEDPCIAVNADPSHNWEGETWLDRVRKVGEYIAGAHVKNHIVIPGMPLRCMEPDWKKRPMQFCNLRDGQIDMVAYVQELLRCGYVDRYCKLHGTDQAPLVVEAESAYDELNFTSVDGIKFVNEMLCRPVAAGSFEDGMGA